jgi:hypothetical protein
MNTQYIHQDSLLDSMPSPRMRLEYPSSERRQLCADAEIRDPAEKALASQPIDWFKIMQYIPA